MELLYIGWDTFWKNWLRIGHRSYLIDQLNGEFFNLIVAPLGYGRFVCFVRTYGTHSMKAISYIHSLIDVHERAPWRG